MNEEIEYVIEAGGNIFRKTISKVPIAVPDSLQQSFASNATLKFRHILTIQEWGIINAHLAMNGYAFWTVPVQRILFRCPFKPIESVFVPMFDSKDTAMEMRWDVPDEMRLILLVTTRCVGTTPRWQVEKMYLYAVDNRPEYWRLPLPNVFDDGSVCEGRNVKPFGTATEAILDALTTFDQSRWNSDLWNDVEKTHNMFRFVTDGDKLKTAKINANSWILLCRKVVVDVQRNIVL